MLPDDEVTNKSFKLSLCNTAAGFCKLRAMDFESVAAYPSRIDTLKKLCQEQFKLTRALEEENRRKQGENVCE